MSTVFLPVLFGMIGRLGVALPVSAANPTVVQTYYVPLPENQLLTMFQKIAAVTAAAASPIFSNISISPIANQTIIYYDHYEDGYEADITNPVQTSTQIWGDGNIANGARPGVTTDAGDVINAGGVFVLSQQIATSTTAVTVTSPYQFNGRDKISLSQSGLVTPTRMFAAVSDAVATHKTLATGLQTLSRPRMPWPDSLSAESENSACESGFSDGYLG